jgi:hypothetical protein
MFAARVSPLMNLAVRQATKRFQSSVAAALAGLNGRHFLSIDELRYVAQV